MISAIKEKREAFGLSQTELAGVVGVTQGAVSQWEKGMTRPDISALVKLSEVFCCTVDELLSDYKRENRLSETDKEANDGTDSEDKD